MSQWRRIAIEQVSSCKQIIEHSGNPMAMWIELHSALENACDAKTQNEEVINQIYSYALWCWDKSESGDLLTAVAYAFFEHLPLRKKVCQNLHNRISHENFEALDGVLRYHLSEEEFENFKSRFFDYPSKKAKKAHR